MSFSKTECYKNFLKRLNLKQREGLNELRNELFKLNEEQSKLNHNFESIAPGIINCESLYLEKMAGKYIDVLKEHLDKYDCEELTKEDKEHLKLQLSNLMKNFISFAKSGLKSKAASFGISDFDSEAEPITEKFDKKIPGYTNLLEAEINKYNDAKRFRKKT